MPKRTKNVNKIVVKHIPRHFTARNQPVVIASHKPSNLREDDSSDELIERQFGQFPESPSGFFYDDNHLVLVLQRAPTPFSRFLTMIEPSLSCLDMYKGQQFGPRRRELIQLAEVFESNFSFGSVVGSRMFAKSHAFAYAVPEFFITCGSYGATFTGQVFKRDRLERVIMKIAWDDGDAIESFKTHSILKVTTPQGVKPYDRMVVREAIVSRLLARYANLHRLPWFSPYSVYAYLKLSMNNVRVETTFGSNEFVPWTLSERESYPSVLKPDSSSQSLFLVQAPRPNTFVASILLQEMSYYTFSNYSRAGHTVSWSLLQLYQFCAQIALGIISYQTSLHVEHGDLHTSNIMLNPIESTMLVALDKSEYDVSSELKQAVRFIDWGFAKSDLLFGHGDVKTCISIESEKRLYLTDKLMFPCEYFDMACCLVDLKRTFARSEMMHAWIQEAMGALVEDCLEAMHWETMSSGRESIERTGLYPVSFYTIDGNGMKRWFKRVFSSLVRDRAPKGAVTLDLPQRSLSTRAPESGQSLSTLLASVISSHPIQLKTDAPLVHANIMSSMAQEAFHSIRPMSDQLSFLEKKAFIEFFRAQMFNYSNKQALSPSMMYSFWMSMRDDPRIQVKMDAFMTREDYQRAKHLQDFAKIVQHKHGVLSTVPETIRRWFKRDKEHDQGYESEESDLSGSFDSDAFDDSLQSELSDSQLDDDSDLSSFDDESDTDDDSESSGDELTE